MSISRILHKTPLINERSFTYETNINDELIRTILSSRFIGEGLFVLEQFSMQNYTEQYFHAPSFDKYSYPTTRKNWEFENETAYELVLDKASFLPLDTKQQINVFKFVSELDFPVFTQILFCKRLDDWRHVACDLYESYLSGNDNPINNKMIRNVQSKVLNLLNNIVNYKAKRDQIVELEDKILQHNHRFECRFVLYELENQQKFEENIQKQLEKLNLFNELTLKKVKNPKNLIDKIKHRAFQQDLVSNMLSEKELISLICENEIERSQLLAVIPVKKTKGVSQKLEESQLLQRAIQILPFKESQQREVDQTLPKRINNAFIRVGLTKKELKIVETHIGSSLLKVQMSVPSDLVFTSFKKKLVDIQAALGNEGVTIEIGDKPDTINVYMPLEEREAIYFRRVLESEEFQTFVKNNPLPFIIGESVNGGFMFGDLTKLRHLLISGTTGSGKSVYVNIIILCLLLCVPSDELDMYLVDPKMVEFTMFEGFPQVKEIIVDMKKATTLLDKLCIEMDKRYELMSKIGAREIAIYNQKSEHKLPYIVCIVDEFSDLMMVNGNVEEFIVRLGQKARGAGIHLVLATQRPSVDVVTGLIKANMPSRFSFKVLSGVDSKTILDTVGAEKLLGLGDGYAKIEGNAKQLERFQSPVLTLNKMEEESIFEELKLLFKDAPTSENDIGEIEPEEDNINKLKRIIANSAETRISELQKEMKIKINTVSELVKQLVEEGFLTKEGKSYVVTASEEELNKWRDS